MWGSKFTGTYLCLTSVQCQCVTPVEKLVARDESDRADIQLPTTKSNLRKKFHPPANISLQNKASGYVRTNLENTSRYVDETALNMFFQHAGHTEFINILIRIRTEIFRLETIT